MNKKLQLGLFTAIFLIIALGAYVVFINSNKTPSQNPASITYLISSADPTKYCNGADLDSAGYQKTITVKKATSTAEINPSKLQTIKAVINAGTTGMCRSVMNQLNITENNGTVYLPPIDGWAGISIVMCSCRPQVEVNLLQIPGLTKVVWSTTVNKADSIRLTTPLPNQTISSPLVIRGQARGSWFFEASFPVVLTDWDGRIIAQGVAQAKGDWMTTEFVPFEATIAFTVDKNIYSNRGSLILKKDNPSGLPQNDDALEIPIVFAGGKSSGFNQPTTLRINDKIIFPDGLSLILKEINDSRCKSGLTCIWQGELSALFQAGINGSLKEIRLSTVNNKKVSVGGYTFSLGSATEISATISVSVNSVGNNTSGVGGYIHLGPICPVERIPPDPNCADKPFIGAQVNAVAKSSGILTSSTKSDAGGNFRVNLPLGTYLIKISAQNKAVLPTCGQQEATVVADKFTVLDISCDTGIR